MNPTDRSISPQISSSTSPIAMIADWRHDLRQQVDQVRLGEERRPGRGDEPEVEDQQRPSTTKTVASRCRANSAATPAAPAPCPAAAVPAARDDLARCWTVSAHVTSPFAALKRRAGAVLARVQAQYPAAGASSYTRAPGPSGAGGRGGFWIAPDRGTSVGCGRWRSPRTLVLVLVRRHVALRDEGQAGVGVGRDERAAGQVVQVQVQRGQEALQVRVLVDGEVGWPAWMAVSVPASGRIRRPGCCQPGVGERLRRATRSTPRPPRTRP